MSIRDGKPFAPTSHGVDGDVVDPGTVGMDGAKLDEARGLIDALHRTGKYPAIQACIRRRGKIVLHRVVGDYRPIQ
ncbi:MAG: hypothetical protein ACNA8W_14690, partial [Bradymonadaceae bacterium]